MGCRTHKNSNKTSTVDKSRGFGLVCLFLVAVKHVPPFAWFYLLGAYAARCTEPLFFFFGTNKGRNQKWPIFFFFFSKYVKQTNKFEGRWFEGYKKVH